jgi:hypothetical protein
MRARAAHYNVSIRRWQYKTAFHFHPILAVSMRNRKERPGTRLFLGLDKSPQLVYIVSAYISALSPELMH